MMKSNTPIRNRRSWRQKRRLLNDISIFVLVVIMGAGFVVALGSAQAMGTSSASDFVRKASMSNEFEIESSKLALQKSQNNDVKNFAQEMVDDHTKAGDNLTTATADANMNAPAPTLDRKHQKIMAKLNADSPQDFDKDYVKAQVKAHDEAVSLFKDYAKHGDNDTIKTFAGNTLPTLKDHQQKVDQLKASF